MNDKSKEIIKRIVVVIVSLFIIYGIHWLIVPLSRNKEAVRSYFLKHIMPIGTSWDEANAMIAEKGWMVPGKSEKQGVVLDVSSHLPIMGYEPEEKLPSSKIRIGSKCIYCYFGHYYAPFEVSVKAALAFDENGRLIDVVIVKETDSL